MKNVYTSFGSRPLMLSFIYTYDNSGEEPKVINFKIRCKEKTKKSKNKTKAYNFNFVYKELLRLEPEAKYKLLQKYYNQI